MNILLVCACGSSTSVVLQKMKENLTSDEPWTIEAKSLSEAKKVMGKYDYVLLAPQIRYQITTVQSLAEPYEGLTVMNMEPADFGRCNGKAILDQIRRCEQAKQK